MPTFLQASHDYSTSLGKVRNELTLTSLTRLARLVPYLSTVRISVLYSSVIVCPSHFFQSLVRTADSLRLIKSFINLFNKVPSMI